MEFLVAVDGSDPSIDALTYAIDLAKPIEADVTIVHAVTPRVESRNGERIIEDTGEAERRGNRILDEAAATARDRGVAVDTALVYGRPAKAIADYARETDIDAVYVGHRGLTREREELVGSVAKDLVDRSPVPVTVVR